MDWVDSRNIAGFVAETMIAVLAYQKGRERKILESYATPVIEHLWTYAQTSRKSFPNSPRLWMRRITEARRACGSAKNPALADCVAAAEAAHFAVEVFDHMASHDTTPFSYAFTLDVTVVLGAFMSAAAHSGIGDYTVAKTEARWRYKDFVKRVPSDTPENLQAAFEALWLAAEYDAAKRLLREYCGEIREGHIRA